MRIVSAAKHAAVLARLDRQARELEASDKLSTERQVIITRLRAELEQLRDAKPDSPVQQPKPAVGDAELRRQLDLARRTIRELDERLGQMQDSHIADTRELHDLRQGAAS